MSGEQLGAHGRAYWRGRPVLVTGASGFLGSWLVSELVQQRARVVCLIRDVVPDSYLALSGGLPAVVQVAGSLDDYAGLVRILNEHEIDTCFHLAAQPLVTVALKQPLSTFESNIRGTWLLLEAVRCVRPECRVAVASSDKVYGDSKNLPYREDGPLLGMGPYDVSKVCTDLIAQTYARVYGLRIAIARCGNFYGPGDLNWSRIVPGTCRALVEGRRPVIRSNGLYVRDYLFIQDAARAYIELAEKLEELAIQGQSFNFGTEQPTSVLSVVESLTRLSGKGHLAPQILDEAKEEIKEQYLSTEKARRLLGWRSHVSLSEGLTRSYEWYAQFLTPRA